MIGLLKKDIYALLRYARIFPVFILLYAGMSLFMDESGTFITSTIIMICATMSVSAFAYDDMAKWNTYALSMPIRRTDLVYSKYLLAALLLSVSLIISGLMQWLIYTWNGTFQVQEFILSISVLSGMALLFVAFLFPLIFKFGVENSRIMILMLLAVPSAAVIAISKLSLPWLNLERLLEFMNLLPLLGLVCFFCSVLLSAHIVFKQEF